MKKYDVHVILGDKFHSVVIECARFVFIDGAYIFFRDNDDIFAWYPACHTIIEEHKPNRIPQGSGQFR